MRARFTSKMCDIFDLLDFFQITLQCFDFTSFACSLLCFRCILFDGWRVSFIVTNSMSTVCLIHLVFSLSCFSLFHSYLLFSLFCVVRFVFVFRCCLPRLGGDERSGNALFACRIITVIDDTTHESIEITFQAAIAVAVHYHFDTHSRRIGQMPWWVACDSQAKTIK